MLSVIEMRSKAFVMWVFLCMLLLIDITLRLRQDVKKVCDCVNTNDMVYISNNVPITAQNKVSKPECVVNIPCVYPDDVDLRVIIMSYNRDSALRIVLESLSKLDSMGDTIALEIWIDRSTSHTVHQGTLNVAENFKWDKGPFRIHIQSKHAGIYGQWIDTWRPKEGSNELALLVEDDLIISPHTWRWLKAAHAHYGDASDTMGYSTQSERVNTAAGKSKSIDAGNDPVFLYRLIGSWGFAPHPKVWRAFQDWFHEKRNDNNFHPYVSNIVMTSWYKNFEKKGTSNSMWTMWFIYYTNERNLYCLYSNLNRMTSSKNKCLAVHREEPGLHYSGKARSDAHTHLLVDWSPSYIDFPEKTKKMSWYGKAENNN